MNIPLFSTLTSRYRDGYDLGKADYGHRLKLSVAKPPRCLSAFEQVEETHYLPAALYMTSDLPEEAEGKQVSLLRSHDKASYYKVAGIASSKVIQISFFLMSMLLLCFYRKVD